MYAHVNKEQSGNQSEDKQAAQKEYTSGFSFQFQDNRPDSFVQRKLQETAGKSPKALQIAQLQKLAGGPVIGTQVRIQKATESVEMEAQGEADTNEAPIQLQLKQGSAYRVNQTEQGRHRTPTGNVSPHPRSSGFPSTQVGKVYLVVDFTSDMSYMQLQPLTPSGGADFYIPVGNDGYYDIEPELARDPNPGPLDVINDRDNTELLEVSGNAYNNQDPDAADITQGELGNCWLIAPMMAMTMSTHWNQHIATLIQQQGQDYQVELGNTVNINTGLGTQTQMVTISGWIPTVDVGHGQMEFLYAQQQLGVPGQLSGGHSAPVWPSLLEKAAAKSFGGGSYQGLDDNDASVGFQLLGHTQPQTLMPPGPGTQPYANMILAMGSDAAGTATTKKDNASSQTLSTDANNALLMSGAFLGLIEDHVYIILPASSVQNLVLQNPHGKNHPTGPIPQANVDDVISRIDYLPVPQPQVQQPQVPQQQVQQVQAPQQQVQAPPQLANAVVQAHQQVQQFNQQQQMQAVQQVQLQPLQVQPQLLQQLQVVQQQIAQFQQQQFQQAQQANQASGSPTKKQKPNPGGIP